ncbi:MAG: ABC transporter ATP-binding protein [Caldilineaceae bacterium]|nr:ABC transporter ATP-binding protein [Caldilineaceae bacterium]MCB0144542.1 ABC transporter ATP-binding protein [Caldilineaceae bacterium]
MLTVSHLSAGYGKLTVLHEIDVTIPAGQFTAILGPNGSGKSTLLKTIFGLTDCFGGDIILEGQPLIGLATEQISRQGIAYIPQRQNVFASMTVRENLLLALRHLNRTQAETAIAEATALFPILGQRAQQRAGKLSGGERQMLAIAIGWLSRPRLMLLDEPSAGLSPLFVTEVFRTLRQLCQTGITLAVVEQNARSVLRWCDHAYVLREGQVAFQGTAAEILADEETVKGYLGVGRIS